MSITNKEKFAPKNPVKFNLTLSEEQKQAKCQILEHPFNFILGKAGSGKTLLAVQIALDMFFKRKLTRLLLLDQPYLQKIMDFFLAQSMKKWSHG